MTNKLVVLRTALRRRMRSLVANCVSLAGASVTCAGLWAWSHALALVVAGVFLLLIAQGIEAPGGDA